MGKSKGANRFANLEISAIQPDAGTRSGAPVRDVAFYMREGLARELAGEHEKALTNYSAALGEDPLHIEAWTRQLWMLLYLGEAAEAVVWANKALQTYPRDPDILSLKALAQWRCGFAKEARELNDAALSATRESANVWLARGEMQAAADNKSANACFKHAAAAPGETGLAEMRAGDILLLIRKYAEAIPFCRAATVRFHDSSWAWYIYGLAQRGVGRDEYARAAFMRAHNLSPRDSRYRAALKRRRSWLARAREWLFGNRS
ncbi:MAG: hypothetical protein LBU23_12945 [Planctomycetota bacterium]|jgi:tetratricopeptide (TPR) repeat protein|nr:hypothetical protein [Planctomycetota bacterium]